MDRTTLDVTTTLRLGVKRSGVQISPARLRRSGGASSAARGVGLRGRPAPAGCYQMGASLGMVAGSGGAAGCATRTEASVAPLTIFVTVGPRTV